MRQRNRNYWTSSTATLHLGDSPTTSHFFHHHRHHHDNHVVSMEMATTDNTGCRLSTNNQGQSICNISLDSSLLTTKNTCSLHRHHHRLISSFVVDTNHNSIIYNNNNNNNNNT
eukprot:Nitzschia sp. Nitz4//scaffold28_size193895//51672//52010//NITZ4_001641-RA/size193895-est2genome-gene-0.175-mRNA-1//1//CDS//3329545910//888//frame0